MLLVRVWTFRSGDSDCIGGTQVSSDESIWRTRVLSATMPEYVGEAELRSNCGAYFINSEGGNGESRANL